MGRGSNVLQPVNDEAKRLARCLIRTARSGALATSLPGGHGPLASRALVACDAAGEPLLLVSNLARHAEALAAQPRCSILFGETGSGDPLAAPRISVFGGAEAVEPTERDRIRARFLARHPTAATYCDFADFHFLRIRLDTASLNAGFARAYELERADLIDTVTPELEERLARAVDHMNADHANAVDAIARAQGGSSQERWRIATADARGFEIGGGDLLMRIEFERAISGMDDIRPAFVAVARNAQPLSPMA